MPGAVAERDTRPREMMWRERVRERGLAVVLCVPWVIWGLWQALALHFVCDDAYISFRYVRNLLDGHGLVFNPGEYVEGYTNFLWVLEVAALWAVGIAPEVGSVGLSLLATIGTMALVARMAFDTPHDALRPAVAMAAVALYATNRSVAVWATSGLETRQFTFLVVLGVYLLTRRATHPERLQIAGSVALGLAELTRPEALLIGPCVMLWWAADAWHRKAFTVPGALRVGLPFAGLVGAQFLWRIAYYGEILPNTYYAKSVRPWWEAGITYWGFASIEHALYLVVPLAVLGTAARLRSGDMTPGAAWIFLVPIAVHLARLGGDHFEFRVLDEYWPFLAVFAAEGIATLAMAAGRARWTVGALTLSLCLVYAGVPQAAHTRLAAERSGRKNTVAMSIQLTPDNAPTVYALPGMSLLMPSYNAWSAWCIEHWIGSRRREHAEFARMRTDLYGGYEAFIGQDVLPDGAVAAEISVGIVPFLLPELTVIDVKGLTDHAVARMPVHRSNDKRKMAHDRQATPAYLESRGVNIEVHPLRPRREAALKIGEFAVELGPGAWMPFDSPDPAWVREAFADRGLVQRAAPKPAKEAPTAVLPPGTRGLGDFEEGWGPWTSEGAFGEAPASGPRGVQHPITGVEGTGFANSFHASEGDKATGLLRSPRFEATGELRFLVGGGHRKTLGVFLVGAEGVLDSWRGTKSETLTEVVVDLSPWNGQSVHIEVRDDDVGGWGHVLADGFQLRP